MPKGLLLRGKRFYYRHVVPVDVQRLTGRTEIWRSLHTDSLKSALRRMPATAARVEAEIERARETAGMMVDMTLLQPSLDDRAQRVWISDDLTVRPKPQGPHVDADSSLTFGQAYARYMADPTHSWSARTREAYETCRRLAVSVVGSDTPMQSISRVHCRDFMDVLRSLPRNAAKRFPNLSAREASEQARIRNDITVISTANANACLANLSSFLNWAVNEELLGRNPTRGLRLSDETAKRDKRHPFSPGQLRAIFDAPLYRGCVDGERGYAKTGWRLEAASRRVRKGFTGLGAGRLVCCAMRWRRSAIRGSTCHTFRWLRPNSTLRDRDGNRGEPSRRPHRLTDAGMGALRGYP